MKALLLALAVLASSAAAQAAGFDTYQLIMWQEHTAAEVAGLERLGFTATKLRATGGQIEASELAQHEASGLPWYLENIATDFYSPYHRYTPGKAVTWLFDAALQRRLRDPTDRSIFVRDPSLSDPVWLQRVASRLQTLVRAQRASHPLFYDLADEAGIGDLAAAWDADIGPASLAAMRAWLRTQYLDLAALNAEWGSDFASWDEVVPELTDAALRGRNAASWGDFKAWMDVAFARAVRAGTDAVHQADAEALAGLEGAQIPGWGGYDYGLLAPSVDVMEIYDDADNVDLARAANPKLILLRTSFGAGDSADAWRNLLQGGAGTIVWDDGETIVGADGAPKPRGRELAALVAGLRAMAPTLRASRPAPDPVAVLVSQASFRAQWLLDNAAVGAWWTERQPIREYADNPWRGARRDTLERLRGIGIQPRLLTSPMLEGGGALAEGGTRVLILPHAIALSEAELTAIRAFATAGGTVLADTEPGLFDAHLRRRAAPPLAGVAQIPEPMQLAGTPPGQGRLGAEAELLAAAGVKPRALFLAANGGPAPGLEIRWFADDAQQIVSIQPLARYAAPSSIDLLFAEPRTVRDLRQASPAQTGTRFHLSLDPAEPTILSVVR